MSPRLTISITGWWRERNSVEMESVIDHEVSDVLFFAFDNWKIRTSDEDGPRRLPIY
jgi:hypothetical protein